MGIETWSSCNFQVTYPKWILRKVLFPTPSLALAVPPAPVKALLSLLADSPSAPVNVTVKHLKANSAVVTWDVLEDEVVIGFAISQQVLCLELPNFSHIHLPLSSLSVPKSSCCSSSPFLSCPSWCRRGFASFAAAPYTLMAAEREGS